jgi:hypothetical protein
VCQGSQGINIIIDVRRNSSEVVHVVTEAEMYTHTHTHTHTHRLSINGRTRAACVMALSPKTSIPWNLME